MGRDKKNEMRKEHYTKMFRNLMQTDAWNALSVWAQALYPWIKLEWHGPNANNNGKLRLSVRQAMRRLGCSKTTAARAFHDLQAKGFIFQTEGAALGVAGCATAPTYEVTEISMPGHKSGRRLYQSWKSGSDFEVAKAPVNNRSGHGKTLHQKN